MHTQLNVCEKEELPCFLYLIQIFGSNHYLTERLWQYHQKWKQPKWKFSTFCGLPGTTSYPYLPLRTIDPPDTRSHPRPTGWGPNLPTSKFTTQKTPLLR